MPQSVHCLFGADKLLQTRYSWPKDNQFCALDHHQILRWIKMVPTIGYGRNCDKTGSSWDFILRFESTLIGSIKLETPNKPCPKCLCIIIGENLERSTALSSTHCNSPHPIADATNTPIFKIFCPKWQTPFRSKWECSVARIINHWLTKRQVRFSISLGALPAKTA